MIGGVMQFGSLKSAEQLGSTITGQRHQSARFFVILDVGMQSGARHLLDAVAKRLRRYRGTVFYS